MDLKFVPTENEALLKVAIVVPIYKSFAQITENEKRSLNQLKVIFPNRHVFLLFPKYINSVEFFNFFSPNSVKIILMSNKYFGTPARGNRLGLSLEFYKIFKNYEYILIHHIDAYVFSDELDYWCSKNLDFVGAPWSKVDEQNGVIRHAGVGNGGFSLRKVSSFIRIANDNFFILLHTRLNWFYWIIESDNFHLPKKMFSARFAQKIFKKVTVHEDGFWGLTVPKYHPWFQVAKPEDAMKFSFEVIPRQLYILNCNKLPFGCHAWDKNDPDFWKPFIYSKENA